MNKELLILCKDCIFSKENYQEKIYCTFHSLPFDKTFACIHAQKKPTYQHQWTGWPGAYCMKCGSPDHMEYAIANQIYDPYTDKWINKEEEKKFKEYEKCSYQFVTTTHSTNKMNEKILLVIANVSDSSKMHWAKDFKEIIYKKFPEINPSWSANRTIEEAVTPICSTIGEFIGEDDTNKYIYMHGDASVCYYTFLALKDENLKWIFPQYDEDLQLIQWRGL